MAEKSEAAAEVESKDEDGKGKSAQGVVDYLQAPRKKRRSFIIVATGASTDPETTQAMIRFIKASYPKYSVATPQNADEFVRQFSRNINLAIVDDSFVGLDETLDLVKSMKQKKNESAIPVLFLTKDPDTLVHAYSKKLALWHEVDEYIVPALSPRNYLFAKIKTGIEERYRRRSRRYKMSFPVAYTLLDYGERRFKGSIVDLSVHGAQLVSLEGHLFNPRDQMIIHLPYSSYVSEGTTDVIRMSAKVRRIFISGDRAGISWEHMSDIKIEQVSKLLMGIVDQSLGRQAAATRAKIAKMEAEENVAMARPAVKEKSKAKDAEKEKAK
ncbi:MAG: PilZ domain-containing protein [Proteobacteria bacterium]|nr:PilZ domain-containing protein [Pseudomonadota bacterium]